MERLVKDAAKIDKSFKYNTKTVVKNKKAVTELDMSYADIVQAIHIVQTNMGITGTTAEEASKTISGSIGMLKSAWANLITGMGEGNEVKLDGLVNAVVDAGKTVFANIMPVAEKVIYGFIHLIEASVPVLLETVPGMVSRLAPRLVKAAGTLVTSIGKSLPSLMSSIVKNLPQALKSVERFIIVWVGGAMGRLFSNLAGYKIPTNQSIFQNLFTRLFDLLDKAAGKVKEFWTVVVQPIVQDLAKLGQRITHAIVLLLDGLKPIWEEVSPKISKAFQDIAGFWRDTLFPILDSIIFYVTTRLIPDIVEWVGIAVDFVGKAFVAIGQFWSDTLYPTLRRIWAYVTNTVVPNAVEAWNQFREKAREVFAKIRDFWNDPLKPTLDNIRKLIVEEVVPKVIEAWGNFKEKAQSAFDAVALYWNDHLYPVIWYIWFLITQYVVPKVVEAWGVFRTKAEETFTNLAPIIEESLSNGQKNLTDFTDAIGAIADGDWTTAIQKFESIVERTFNSVGDLIKDAVKPAINDVIGWLNGLIAKVESGLNWIVDGLNKVLSFSWGELKIGPVKIWDAGSVHLDLEHVVLDRLQKIGEETYGAGRNKGYGRHDFFANGGILGEGQSAFVGEYAPELLRVIGGKAMVTPLSKVPARFPGGPETFEPRVAQSRPVTVIMQVGEKEFGRLAFELGSAEEQRVGVKLAKGGAY